MKLTTITIIIIFFIINTNLLSKTPYHSIDENNYNDVIRQLETPEQLANYMYYNFSYSSDYSEHHRSDWHYDSKAMFKKKTGDCEDYAEFANDVLNYHHIKSEIFFLVKSDYSAHAVCLFKYKGKINYIDSMSCILHSDFSSTNEALRDFFGRSTIFYEPKKDESDYRINETADVSKYEHHYIGYERLDLHYHLTKCDYGFHYYMPGFYNNERMGDSGKSYIKNPNKMAFGFLFPIKNEYFTGLGYSFSGHGYYSNFENSKKMLSCHMLFLNSRIGLTIHCIDYNGLDIDTKILDLSFIKSYICIRDFDVVDAETDFIIFYNFLNVIFEKVDKQYLYGIEINLDNTIVLKINNLEIGFKYNVKFINFGINFNLQEKNITKMNINIPF